MSNWLNTKIVINKKAIKPCKFCGYCPYGQLVEEFPIEMERNKRSCKVFGHDCPIFYLIEPFSEEKKPTKKEIKELDEEFEKIFFKGDKK